MLALWVGNAAMDGFEALRELVLPRPVAVIAEPLGPRVDPVLQARVQAAASLSQGTTGVVVRSLDDGTEADVNADGLFPAASLFKLPVLAATLDAERQGRITPDTPLAITEDSWADGAGVLQARVGERLPVRELLRLMVQQSDNIAALVLLDTLGADNVNATIASLGLQDTRVRDHRDGDTTPHTTTARDMAELLGRIATGRLFGPKTSEQALELLELRQANTWLGDDLPFFVRVAHKWGDLPEARHDAGIVFTPRGSYVCVVLTEGGRPEETRGAIAAVSRAAFDRLISGR